MVDDDDDLVSLDAYQRLQMARNNEQPPGSLRLARRQHQQPVVPSTKAMATTKRTIEY